VVETSGGVSEHAVRRPAVSVVIPTHNTRDLTMACLASLSPQEEIDAEIIVVDDGSVDGTSAAINALHPHVRVMRSESTRAFTAAANRGVSEAHGSVILLLNSDTEVERAALAKIAGAFAERPRLGVASATLVSPDGREQWSGGGWPTPFWLFVLASGAARFLARFRPYRRARGATKRRVDWVSGAAMAIRRAAWEELGPLDERFAFYAQDADFCLRARDAGWEVDVLAVRVVHHGGATIGRERGAADGHHPALLWTDLLRLVLKREGAAAARRSARAIRAGAVCRLAALRLARLSPRVRARDDVRRESDAFRAGRRAVRDWARSTLKK
jgi:GT2 family glycosyltransferase